jgi:hypothetical protein
LGVIVSLENLSSFANFELIQKEFEINEEELKNDLGLNGAIYNRIALKDLK